MTQRVLHIGKFFPPHCGGMETFLSDLVQAQRAQGIDSHVLVHGQALADDPPWVRRVPVQAQLIYAPIALGFRAALARAIREIRPQVLHLHLPNNAVFWALTVASAREIPWVVHWHSDVLVSDERLALRMAYTLYRPFEQAVLERTKRIIVTSRPSLQDSEPLRHCPPGDASSWRQTLEQLAQQPQALEQWGLPGQQALRSRFSIAACARSIAAQYRMFQFEPIPQSDQLPLLIVIPARDEAATIGMVVSSLIAMGWHHIFVIDDQSSDDTGNIARRAGATVARPVLPLGAWGGAQLGVRHALARGYRAVITMDADGQHEVQDIPRLLAGAVNADIVIGANPERASRLRHIAWRWFRVIADFELRDITSGFRYYNRQAIEILAANEATLLDYQDVGVLLLLRKAGLCIVEVPVSMNARQVGRSRIFYSWFSVARYMISTTVLCLARWQVSPKNRS